VATSYRELDWYSAPRYYDLVFSSLSEREAEFLTAVATEYGPGNVRRVFEPACGSARLMEKMALRGFDVAGIDLSPNMVRYAKERLARNGVKARVRVADMSDFRSGKRFHMAHCLVSSFKYLLTEQAAASHLQCVCDSLVAGGIYVLGFHLSEYAVQKQERERWVGKKRGLEVVCNITSWPPNQRSRMERIRSRLVVKEHSRTDRFETHWKFRTYDELQVKRLLAKVPDFEHVSTYDMSYDLDGEQELGAERLDQVLILRKRRSR